MMRRRGRGRARQTETEIESENEILMHNLIYFDNEHVSLRHNSCHCLRFAPFRTKKRAHSQMDSPNETEPENSNENVLISRARICSSSSVVCSLPTIPSRIAQIITSIAPFGDNVRGATFELEQKASSCRIYSRRECIVICDDGDSFEVHQRDVLSLLSTKCISRSLADVRRSIRERSILGRDSRFVSSHEPGRTKATKTRECAHNNEGVACASSSLFLLSAADALCSVLGRPLDASLYSLRPAVRLGIVVHRTLCTRAACDKRKLLLFLINDGEALGGRSCFCLVLFG